MDKKLELELIDNYASKKCRQSIGRLLKSYLPLIKKEASSKRTFGFDFDELVNEGVIGFCKAVSSFNSCDFEGTLGHYASHFIKREIGDFVFNNRNIVKTLVSREQRKLISAIKKISSPGFTLSCDECREISELTGMTIADVQLAETFMNGRNITISSYDDSFFYEQADQWVNWELFYSEGTADELIILCENEAKLSAVLHSLRSLDSREREIIEARWLSDKKETMKDIGERMAISVERVRQLEQRAISKIKSESSDWLMRNALK